MFTAVVKQQGQQQYVMLFVDTDWKTCERWSRSIPTAYKINLISPVKEERSDKVQSKSKHDSTVRMK